MRKSSLMRDFFGFIFRERKWWMIPLVVILLLLAIFIVFLGGSPLAALLYPLL